MAWTQLSIVTTPSLAEKIADWLNDHGAIAVTMQEGGEDEVFEPLPGQTPLWEQTKLVGLFEDDVDVERLMRKLERMLAPTLLPAYEITELEDQAWERVWLKDFKPMKFGKRTWIIPSAYDVVEPDAVNIRLDPGLAFGTGTHPTTSMCIAWIDEHMPNPVDVLDFGCGSGILAIAAAKHGAQQVWAVDIDPQAVQATVENAQTNGVGHLIHAGLSQTMEIPKQLDVVLANILANPLIELANFLVERVKIGGHIVLSGILSEQKTHIETAYQSWIEFGDTVEVNGWVMLAGVRKR